MPISIFSKFTKASTQPISPADPTPTFEAEKKDEWMAGEEGQLSIDLYQTDSDLILRSTIAGVNESDISVSITNDMLTIRGKRQQDTSIPQENFYYQECYWGAFSRSIVLPLEVKTDEVRATIKNGVLTIVMPKAQSRKSMEIKVKVE